MSLPARGFPLVIAAPSGAGKTSLAHALVERAERVTFSVSATTRPRRPHETEGADYHFVEDAEFERMIEAGELVEWAEVHGRRYGTPGAAIDAAVAEGGVVVLDIDVQGARQIRRRFADAVLVFVLPPSAAELGRRLSGRGSEARAERRRRLANARAELPSALEFDYVVVNDDFEAGVAALLAIVAAESRRASRSDGLATFLAQLDHELDHVLEES
ncbi:MAG TPA: guanylate kinase [Longimicrobiales bacterium]|nr:guanylate kinase [Longimicrobiales bacterium]